ncbi:arylsulfatase [Moorena sp. SIO4G3]|uniref:arylsulfatase n=1 Tax=Moorena sp. SIO4G3 TaxID=2607821 RepID=UPI00142CB78D|nr:arylsulfatase [Moorena sp. SIO4G3]NEO80761.1 arylsulfatase [Moorena sp. SIO4G3]
MKKILRGAKVIVLCFLMAVFSVGNIFPAPALAQQMLPHPAQPFTAKIGLSYEDSANPYSDDVKPALESPELYGIENPPNILVVLLDDVGYSQLNTFGGSVPTATLDTLAENGLRYTEFHTTALCAPTRSALLTGHNHHSASNGILPEMGTGFPGYSSMIPDSTATIGKVLHEYGYDTSWYGKDHNVPQWETSIAGPFDHWPTNLGFDYYYGFVGGSTDQYHPASLVENTTRLQSPDTNADGTPYHLTVDLADHAIDHLRQLNAVAPQKPFFAYFATGATHAPHQVPKKWIDAIKAIQEAKKVENPEPVAADAKRSFFDLAEIKAMLGKVIDGDLDVQNLVTAIQEIQNPDSDIVANNPDAGSGGSTLEKVKAALEKAMGSDLTLEEVQTIIDNSVDFSKGWDYYRDQTFQRQKDLGVIPQDAYLTKRDDSLPAWDSLGPEHKKVYTAMMEVFAAFTAQTDHEVGRVIKEIENIGKLDNTLIFYIVGDNGSSAEGELEGLLNELSVFNQINEPFYQKVEAVDDGTLGSYLYYNHFPAAWAWAMDTPFQWTKQIASHFGGTRNGLVVSWPNGIDEAQNNTTRYQFSHAIDIMPTILEAIGIDAPVEVDGIAQKPMEGTSFFDTFNNPHHKSSHTTQYFEMLGNQGIYNREVDYPDPADPNLTINGKGWMASAIRSIPWDPDPIADETLLHMNWELYCIEDCGTGEISLDENGENQVSIEGLNCDQQYVQFPSSDYPDDGSTTVSLNDYAQAHNLADQCPNKLDEMVKLFYAEAARYNVLPLNDQKIERYDVALRPSWVQGERTTFTYPDKIRVTEGAIPDVRNKYHTITANVTIPEGTEPEGMLATFGGRFAGYGFFINKDHKLEYNYNLSDVKHTGIVSDDPIDSSYVSLKFVYVPNSDENEAGATVTLYGNGEQIGQGCLDESLLSRFTIDETFDVGFDTGTPVIDDYTLPFDFNGTLDTVTVDISPPEPTDNETICASANN